MDFGDPHHRGGFHPHFGETQELLIAWLILSAAFAILYSNMDFELFQRLLPICGITVGLGFVLHEMGHKYLAQRYGMHAIFRANYQGLGLALLMSLVGFVYVAPGAVYMSGGNLTKERNGKISLIGPLINILLGIGFLAIYLAPFSISWIVQTTSWIGYTINTWIGLFNLIPFRTFDGWKIKNWNGPVYYLLVIIAGGLYLMSYVL